jgi:predicted dehydrogenase
LIGCGGRGTGAGSQALSTTGRVKLVAMCDAFKDRLEGSLATLKNKAAQRADGNAIVDVPEDHKFIGFDGYKQAIALADVVLLATPPGFRPLHFEEAVRQGKHIFMEKPMAVDGPGVRRILAAGEEAKKKNLKIGSGFCLRYCLGQRELVKRLHDGAIGDIVSMRAVYDTAGVWDPRATREQCQSEMEYQMRNWYYYVWLSGDQIVEQHCHSLDFVNWVKRAFPVRAQGLGGRQVRTGKGYGEIYDHNFVEFEYADGTRLYSQCRHQPGTWSLTAQSFQGTKGTAETRLFDGMVIKASGETWRHRNNNDIDPYQLEHDVLFDAIRNNKPHHEVEFAAYSSLTSILGRMAIYSGKMVEWDQALNSKLDLSPKSYAWDAPPPTVPDANGYYPIPKPGVTVAF